MSTTKAASAEVCPLPVQGDNPWVPPSPFAGSGSCCCSLVSAHSRETQRAGGCGRVELPGGALRRAGGKTRELKFLPSPATQGLVFEVVAVSVPPAAGLLPRLRSVLAGPLASGCVYLSKPSFYLGCVSRTAGAEGGVEGCCQGAPQPQPPTQSPAMPAPGAPLGHPVWWEPSVELHLSPAWAGGAGTLQGFPWTATHSVSLAQANLSMASISWAAFCCLLCPAASV